MTKKKFKGKAPQNDRSQTELEINLIKFDRTAVIAGLFSYVLYFMSSNKSLEAEYANLQNIQLNQAHPTSPELVAFASKIGLAVTLIFTWTALIRIRQRAENIRAGTDTGTLTPNLNLTIGGLFSLLGGVLFAVGAQQRADELAQITIL